MSTSSRPLVLPPNVSHDAFLRFISGCEELVGRHNIHIVTSKEELADGSYYEPPKTHDPYPVVEQDYFVASTVMNPRSVSKLQKVVQLAN